MRAGTAANGWNARGHVVRLVLVGAAALVVPSVLSAQQYQGSLRFEGYGGVWFDGFRNERGSGDPGWIGGIRMGYETGYALGGMDRPVRLVLDGARAVTAHAGEATVADTIDVRFRNEWWLLTAGLEWDVLSGWWGATADARAGAAWHQAVITHASSEFEPDSTPGVTATASYDRYAAAAVGFSLYRHLTHTIQLRFRAEDVVVDPFGETAHNPALTVGLRLVFD